MKLPLAVLVVGMLLSVVCGESKVSRPTPLGGTEVYSSASARVQRFDDPERGVTCYVTGNGIWCLRSCP